MQYLILGILLGGPLTLYDVHKRFTAGISLFYAASFGSIQHALRQLGAQEWVTPAAAGDAGRRKKKLYIITEPGRRAWREWMHAPITGSDAEPIMLARIYLLGLLPTEERGECLALIRGRMVQDADALAALADRIDDSEIPDAVREVFRYQRATLDYGMRAHALALEWLDQLARS